MHGYRYFAHRRASSSGGSGKGLRKGRPEVTLNEKTSAEFIRKRLMEGVWSCELDRSPLKYSKLLPGAHPEEEKAL